MTLLIKIEMKQEYDKIEEIRLKEKEKIQKLKLVEQIYNKYVM